LLKICVLLNNKNEPCDCDYTLESILSVYLIEFFKFKIPGIQCALMIIFLSENCSNVILAKAPAKVYINEGT
jgi:hypothetical protein